MKKINPFYLNKNEAFWLAVSAAALACSFEKINADILVWFAFVPFFAIIRGKNPKEAFYSGFFTGILFHLLTINWLVYTISHYGSINVILSVFIFLLLALYLSTFFGLFALFYKYISNRFDSVFTAPVIWVALEYLKTYLFTGFPWILLGYSLYKRPVLTQFSDITGVYGQSFLIVLINLAIYKTYIYIKTDRQKKYLIEVTVSVIVFIAVIIYGIKAQDISIINKNEAVKIGLTQGNIPQALKWNEGHERRAVDTYVALTESTNGAIKKDDTGPTLIVWPETAASFYLQSETKLRGELVTLAKNTGSYLLIGSMAFEPPIDSDDDYLLFNSAFLISPSEGILDRYDKIHLVPFGEYIPIKKVLFFVNKITEGIGDFSSGKEINNLTIDKYGYKFGVLICYESIFPDLTRRFADEGADFLVNITNDSWFGKTAAPYQQVSMAAFRAVENKRYLIRAANTGVTAIIDPFGRVVKKTGIFTKEYLTGEIYTVNKKTFYSEYGDIFSQAASLLSLLLLIGAYIKSRKK